MSWLPSTGLCTTEGCVNGPEEHPFKYDVTNPEPDRCRPRTWVSGMGPEAPVITNQNGASQSEIPAVFTTMPLRALWRLAKLQKYGDNKYGPHNWRGIAEQDHINHAFAHLMADQLGDISDDHLVHATWRLMAALESRLTGQENPAPKKEVF